MEKSPEELYNERMERVLTTVSLKEPDRVPIAPMAIFYAPNQVGYTKKEAMYEPFKLAESYYKVYSPMGWDMVPPLLGIFPAGVFDPLGVQFFKWPGAKEEEQRLEDDVHFQYVEGEYMAAEEYEELFRDPTGFALRKIFPRHFKNLQPFQMFPGLVNLFSGYGAFMNIPMFFGMPQSREMMEKIGQASKALFEYNQANEKYREDMKEAGYPTCFSLFVQAPYDVVSEFLRGMRGAMLDMFRHPEELKRLLNMLVPSSIQSTLMLAQMNPENNIVFIPLHRGADGFMSREQFEEFYWPTLTAIMEGLIENDLIPCPFFEGGYNERLDYLGDFAKKHPGKMIYWFDRTDIIHAKEVFGDYVTIRGNVPGSMLATATPQKVKDYVKKIIDGCAEGGGFIVDGGVSGIPDEAKPENVKAMTDAVFEYGKYRK
jgi:uroporphyrinogen-III decarboxylase